jgi:Ca2+-binding EF-hand superfamily protein
VPVRYYPESLQALVKTTKFSETEIKRMYRGFKAECPNGLIKEENFKNIYSQFFPGKFFEGRKIRKWKIYFYSSFLSFI